MNDSTAHRSLFPSPHTSPLVSALVAAGGAAWFTWDCFRHGAFSGQRPFVEALLDTPSLPYAVVGAMVAAWLVLGSYQVSARRRRYPNEPWMWHGGWSRAGARPQPKGGTVNTGNAVAGVVLASVAFAAMLWIVSTEFIPRTELVSWLFGGTGAAAAGCWVWLGVLLAPRILHGKVYFRYSSFPFFLGQRLSGDLEGLDKFSGLDEIVVSLQCTKVETVISHFTSSRQRPPTYKYTTMFDEARRFNAAEMSDQPRPGDGSGPGGYGFRKVLRFEFDVPHNAPTTDLVSKHEMRWTLRVAAARKGFDLDETFLVPVYVDPARGGASKEATV